MKQQLIFLIGMPGVGKSCLGRQLALRLKFEFIDLDSFIEEKEQQSVSEIFKNRGEAAFRNIETAVISQIIADRKENIIIACGGGTPCFYDNLEKMKQAGLVIYLKAEIDTLLRHIEGSTNVRPLLMAEHVDQRLEQLLQSRSFFYEQAHRIIEVESLSLTTFAQIIQECIEEH